MKNMSKMARIYVQPVPNADIIVSYFISYIVFNHFLLFFVLQKIGKVLRDKLVSNQPQVQYGQRH